MMPERGDGSFWWHLDVLRGVLLKILAASLICSVIAFLFKDAIFSLVFAPKECDFITYRVINQACRYLSIAPIGSFNVDLINTGLAQQFIIHLKTAMYVGVLCISPYIIYELFMFISPALYENEKKEVGKAVIGGYIMFALGIMFNYFVIFPLTFHFLGTYQVAGDVENLISLDSYMDTLMMMSVCMGIVFEIPVLAWILAKIGVVNERVLTRFRKHAIVAILIIAAIITPTSDVFTLLIVSVPMYFLYEVSIGIVKKTTKKAVC